jgi:Ser/Thr protein kinase RdoA (MazF antagonist)
MNTPQLEEICRIFGLSGNCTLQQIGGGTAGSASALTCDGRKFLLRTRSTEHRSRASMEYEHAILDAADVKDLPVAAPCRTKTGNSFACIGDDIYELFPWIEGIPFDPGSLSELNSLATTVALFHRSTSAITRHKEGQSREDDPDRLVADLVRFVPDAKPQFADSIRDRLAVLRDEVHRRYPVLPRAVIHGDLHPGNVLFRDGRVAVLFDFDWANRQERFRDVGDCILFFCADRAEPFDTEDIWSLTQAMRIDTARAATFASGYAGVSQIHRSEIDALPIFLSLRWLQMRIRGARKVAEDRREEFLDRGDLFTVLDSFIDVSSNLGWPT